METVTGSYDPLFDSQETEMLFDRELAKIVQVYQFNCIYVVTNHNSSHLMEQALGDSGKDKLPLNRKNPPAEPGLSSLTNQLGWWQQHKKQTNRAHKEILETRISQHLLIKGFFYIAPFIGKKKRIVVDQK